MLANGTGLSEIVLTLPSQGFLDPWLGRKRQRCRFRGLKVPSNR